eukprot:14056575-Heterocapsa_arctica.AAC.1
MNKESLPNKTKSTSKLKERCVDKNEQMNSNNLLKNVDFKDTGVQGLLPTTTFAGKEPEGKRKIQEQSGTVSADRIMECTISDGFCHAQGGHRALGVQGRIVSV